MSHTKTPWHVQKFADIKSFWIVANGKTIASKVVDREDADFICLAANSHDALLAACKAAMRIESLWLPTGLVHEDHADEAKALHAMREKFLAAIALAQPATQGELT